MNDRYDDEDTIAQQTHRQRELENVSPKNALQLYLDYAEEEKRDWTIQTHESRLDWFLEWCSKEQIKILQNIRGKHILQYRNWRKKQNKTDGQEGCSASTLRANLSTLKVFFSFAEEIEAVPDGFSFKIDPPTLSKEEAVRDVYLSSDRVEPILQHLRKYEYATLEHVLIELMWHTGMRMGDVRALDLGDVDTGENPYLYVNHRLDEGTPLKNGKDGERPVAISEQMATLLDDYIDDVRIDREDEYGREPLLTTQSGRVSLSKIRNDIYGMTRPCEIGAECPHERDPDDCKAARRKNWASECPSSVSPHAIRKGSITHWLNNDWRREHVSERADVSERVLDDHYDQRSQMKKMEQRRASLDSL